MSLNAERLLLQGYAVTGAAARDQLLLTGGYGVPAYAEPPGPSYRFGSTTSDAGAYTSATTNTGRFGSATANRGRYTTETTR